MKFKKMVLTFLVLFMCSFSLIAQGSSESSSDMDSENSGKAKINLYSYYAEQDKIILDTVVQMLEEKYNCDINIIHRADGTGVELKTMAASGNMPDIFEINGPSTTEALITSGNILALDNLIEEKNVKDIVNLTQIVYPRKASDGKIYTINYHPAETFLIYYNNDVFKKYGVKVPTNYDEFVDAVKIFTANNIIPYSLFAAEPWPGCAFFDELVTRRDPRGINGIVNGESKFTDEAFVAAAQELEELSKLGFVSKSAASTNCSQAFQYLETGKAAMAGNGSWYIDQIPSMQGDISFLNNPLSVPGREEETKHNHVGGALNATGYGVNPMSKNLKLAEDVLFDFVYLREKIAIQEFGLSNSLKEEIIPKNPRTKEAQRNSDEITKIESVTYFPFAIPNVDLTAALYDNVNAVISGVMDADTFIKEMQKVIE